jgi:hypothetical protein
VPALSKGLNLPAVEFNSTAVRGAENHVEVPALPTLKTELGFSPQTDSFSPDSSLGAECCCLRPGGPHGRALVRGVTISILRPGVTDPAMDVAPKSLDTQAEAYVLRAARA